MLCYIVCALCRVVLLVVVLCGVVRCSVLWYSIARNNYKMSKLEWFKNWVVWVGLM